jgi:hypothetical protein
LPAPLVFARPTCFCPPHLFLPAPLVCPPHLFARSGKAAAASLRRGACHWPTGRSGGRHCGGPGKPGPPIGTRAVAESPWECCIEPPRSPSLLLETGFVGPARWSGCVFRRARSLQSAVGDLADRGRMGRGVVREASCAAFLWY